MITIPIITTLLSVYFMFAFSQNVNLEVAIESPFSGAADELLIFRPPHIQLVDAILSKNLEFANKLLTDGASPYIGSCSYEADPIIEKGSVVVLNDDAAIFLVVKYRYYEAVMLFIRHDVNWNVRNSAGMTPLLIALSMAAEEIVLALIHADADIFVTPNDNEISPLIIASHNGMLTVVELLLKRQVVVDHRSTGGDTALFFAASGGHVHIIELLLTHGADISATNKMLSTPLMVAVSRNRLDAVRSLLLHMRNNGIDINAKDASHRTAFDIAVAKGYQQIIDELASTGCDIGKRYVYISPEAQQRRSQIHY